MKLDMTDGNRRVKAASGRRIRVGLRWAASVFPLQLA
jgi:hypothetical protein